MYQAICFWNLSGFPTFFCCVTKTLDGEISINARHQACPLLVVSYKSLLAKNEFFDSMIDKGDLLLALEPVIINSSGYRSKGAFWGFILDNNVCKYILCRIIGFKNCGLSCNQQSCTRFFDFPMPNRNGLEFSGHADLIEVV